MKILITTAFILVASTVLNLTAQTEGETNENNSPAFGKRIDRGTITKEAKTPELPASNMDNVADPNERIADNNAGKLAKPKPATKTTSQVVIKKIKYSLDNGKGTLYNLITLIEFKERINEPQNSHLTSTPEYQTLLKDIISLRTEFDEYVISKGIKNCSTSEQNHYLAFLKEEGKEAEYQEAISNLK